MTRSQDRKAEIALWLEAVAPGAFVPEFRFAAPERRYRFDFCDPVRKLAIEYEGGLFMGGPAGHSSVGGILRDISKYNLAAILGYRVIRITAKSIDDGTAYETLERALTGEAA